MIAETFRDEKDVFLNKLCSEPVSQKLALDSPQNTAQISFILVGALSMLCILVPDPGPGKLQIRASNLGAGFKRHSTATWLIDSQELNDSDFETSFIDLLFRYCRHEYGPIFRPRS